MHTVTGWASERPKVGHPKHQESAIRNANIQSDERSHPKHVEGLVRNEK